MKVGKKRLKKVKREIRLKLLPPFPFRSRAPFHPTRAASCVAQSKKVEQRGERSSEGERVAAVGGGRQWSVKLGVFGAASHLGRDGHSRFFEHTRKKKKNVTKEKK